MVGAIAYAIPVFVVMLVLEAVSYRFLPDDEERGYEVRDTATSLSMGLGSLVVGVPWKLLVLLVSAGVYQLAPWHVPMDTWWAWGLIFLADDLAYYWFHRAHHEVRVLWASHVVHHSSQFYNLSTALRQSWTPMTSMPFWLPLALAGFPPWAILTQQAISLLYQFFLHTERVGRLWRPVEWVFNTPSHHRVHHASNPGYLDRNYGGILIVWDRLFGSFAPETEKVVYGLTKNITTHNPVRVAFGSFAELAGDMRSADRWRDRLGYALHHPGWTPARVPVAA